MTTRIVTASLGRVAQCTRTAHSSGGRRALYHRPGPTRTGVRSLELQDGTTSSLTVMATRAPPVMRRFQCCSSDARMPNSRHQFRDGDLRS